MSRIGFIFFDYSSLNVRVAHAYFKYGRFCSSHPIATLLFSIASLLLLSYPLTRLRLSPSTTPFEIVIADNISEYGIKNAGLLRRLEWLVGDRGELRRPIAYIQQMVIKARVNPWNSTQFTPVVALKGPLELAFDITEKINSYRRTDNTSKSADINDFCFRVNAPDVFHSNRRLPSRGCLLLSPALFWNNNRQKFYDDDRILDSIYADGCEGNDSPCTRHFLFGVTDSLAGLKRHYRTNRQRTIVFAVTVVLYEYDHGFIQNLRTYLESDPSYHVEKSNAFHGQDKYILIHYEQGKNLVEHFLLILSYSLVFAYLYFSVRKIEMVKSKWGLAFSSVFTVAASLAMASGICVNFDLIPRLWKGCIFPYLAMLVGIENTLCITRSVVSTPVTLPVELRIAHGLSKEGWLITKTFLIELTVVLFGVLTRIPEIQEFCTLACIGLVVDFYMQLFFYAPCLTFDLLRFSPAEIDRLALIQQRTDHVQLVSYAPVQCPCKRVFKDLLPWLFSSSTDRQTSSLSTRRLVMNSSPSNVSVNMDSGKMASVLLGRMPLPHRAKILVAWSRYRYCQTIFTIVVVVWIAWLALVVRQCNLIGQLANSFNFTSTPPSMVLPGSANAATIESSWVHWELAQRIAFRLWPQLFNIYNVTLSGHYVILLPRIILHADVSPDKAMQARSGMESQRQSLSSGIDYDHTDLGVRISWLEFQMTAVLVMSISIFITVGGFILYVCFVGGSSSTDQSLATEGTMTGQSENTGNEKDTRPQSTRRIDTTSESRLSTNVVPLKFSGHIHDVEIVRPAGDRLVSACLGGRVMIWDSNTGDLLHQLRPVDVPDTTDNSGGGDLRHRRSSAQSNADSCSASLHSLRLKEGSSVWCMDVQSTFIAVGMSNGDIELYDLYTGHLRGNWAVPDGLGATQIRMKGSRVVVARINGALDFVELCDCGSGKIQCRRVKVVRAHQLRINRLLTSSDGLITASDDHTLKLFDVHNFTRLFTFYGHNSAVVNAVLDESMNLMCSSCVDGLICVWDLSGGHLLITLTELTYTASPVSLAFTSDLLVGHAQDGSLRLWNKSTGTLSTTISTQLTPSSITPVFVDTWREGSSLAILGDGTAVTVGRNALKFWDLERGVLLRETKLGLFDDGCTVCNLNSLDGYVVCSEGDVVYRVDLEAVIGKQ